jgi:hypothetical protein
LKIRKLENRELVKEVRGQLAEIRDQTPEVRGIADL